MNITVFLLKKTFFILNISWWDIHNQRPFLSIKWKFPKSGKSLSRTRLRRARLNHGEPFNIITVLITARPFSHSSRGFLYKNMHFLPPCQKNFLLRLLLKRKWESTRKMTTELFNRNNDKLKECFLDKK